MTVSTRWGKRVLLKMGGKIVSGIRNGKGQYTAILMPYGVILICGKISAR